MPVLPPARVGRLALLLRIAGGMRGSRRQVPCVLVRVTERDARRPARRGHRRVQPGLDPCLSAVEPARRFQPSLHDGPRVAIADARAGLRGRGLRSGRRGDVFAGRRRHARPVAVHTGTAADARRRARGVRDRRARERLHRRRRALRERHARRHRRPALRQHARRRPADVGGKAAHHRVRRGRRDSRRRDGRRAVRRHVGVDHAGDRDHAAGRPRRRAAARDRRRRGQIPRTRPARNGLLEAVCRPSPPS